MFGKETSLLFLLVEWYVVCLRTADRTPYLCVYRNIIRNRTRVYVDPISCAVYFCYSYYQTLIINNIIIRKKNPCHHQHCHNQSLTPNTLYYCCPWRVITSLQHASHCTHSQNKQQRLVHLTVPIALVPIILLDHLQPPPTHTRARAHHVSLQSPSQCDTIP